MIFQLKYYYTLRNTGITPKQNLKNLRINREIKEMPSRIKNLKLQLKVMQKISISESGWTFRLNLNKVMRRFILNHLLREYLDQMPLLTLLLDAYGLVLISYPVQKMLKKLMSYVSVESLTLECLLILKFLYQVSNGWWDQFNLLKIA